MSEDFTALQELIQARFESMFVKWGAEKPPRNSLHVSGLIVSDEEWCTRQYTLYHLFPGDIEAPQLQSWDWKMQAVYANGWSLHEKWQSLLRKYTNCLEVETTHYSDAYQLHFTPDAIIELAKQKYLVEIKGYKAAEYEKNKNAPPLAAVHQAQVYMHLLNLKRAIILLENKDTQQFRVWIIQAEEEHALRFLHRALHLRQAKVQADVLETVPARICTAIDEPRAKRCPIRQKCFSDNFVM